MIRLNGTIGGVGAVSSLMHLGKALSNCHNFPGIVYFHSSRPFVPRSSHTPW